VEAVGPVEALVASYQITIRHMAEKRICSWS